MDRLVGRNSKGKEGVQGIYPPPTGEVRGGLRLEHFNNKDDAFNLYS